jgi:hypothetical protein
MGKDAHATFEIAPPPTVVLEPRMLYNSRWQQNIPAIDPVSFAPGTNRGAERLSQ